MDDIDSVKDTGEEVILPPTREEVVGANGEKGRVYVIPHTNLPTFNDRFAKLVKRANRIGVTPPTYTELRQVPKVVKESVAGHDEDGHDIMVERVIMMHHLAIFNPNVVVSGWEFMAKLEHTEEGNILHTLPGKTVPHQYRECDAWCDHCKTRRRRNDTFVLHFAGTPDSILWKQVGRNCLADFLGRDAEKYADAAEMYYSLDQLAAASEGEGEGGFGSGGGSDYAMLPHYLAYVAEVIAHLGWKSRSSAHTYGGQATANIAMTHMWRPRGMKDSDFLFRTPTTKSEESAAAAIAWAEELSDEDVRDSEYLHNIRVIARRGVVGGKQFGYAASIVSSYQRHIGELEIKARRATQVSNYVGEEGERRIFHLLVEKVIQLESDFGISQLHLMSDESGNRFIWYAHGVTLDTGKYHYIKGTIKSHKEREGVKQNMLNRCEEVVMKNYFVVHEGQTHDFQAVDAKDARKVALSVLDIPKLPRGIIIAEKPDGEPTPAPVPPTLPGSWQGDTTTTWESVTSPQPTSSDNEETIRHFED